MAAKAAAKTAVAKTARSRNPRAALPAPRRGLLAIRDQDPEPEAQPAGSAGADPPDAVSPERHSAEDNEKHRWKAKDPFGKYNTECKGNAKDPQANYSVNTLNAKDSQ